MRMRNVNNDFSWSYGKGKNDYKRDLLATAQSIKTRLMSVLGDCFFSLDSGIDWFNLLGGKNLPAINLAVSSTILNTDNVTGINQVSINLNEQRQLTIQYSAQTIYGTLNQQFQYDLGG